VVLIFHLLLFFVLNEANIVVRPDHQAGAFTL